MRPIGITLKVGLAARNPSKPLKPLILSPAGGDTKGLKGFEGFFGPVGT